MWYDFIFLTFLNGSKIQNIIFLVGECFLLKRYNILQTKLFYLPYEELGAKPKSYFPPLITLFSMQFFLTLSRGKIYFGLNENLGDVLHLLQIPGINKSLYPLMGWGKKIKREEASNKLKILSNGILLTHDNLVWWKWPGLIKNDLVW